VLGSGPLTLGGGVFQAYTPVGTSRAVSLNPPGGTFDIFGGADSLFSGTLGGSGTLNKTGLGNLNLSGSNNYTGGTIINGGSVNFSTTGSLPTSGSLQVNAGATINLGAQGNSVFSYGTASQLLTLNGGTLLFGNGP